MLTNLNPLRPSPGVAQDLMALGFPHQHADALTDLIDLVAANPREFVTYKEDFLRFAAAEWTITTTEAGAGSATEALTNVQGGALLLTNAAGDNDRDFLQLAGEPFKFVANKRTAFVARLKVSDATESDVIMGLQITDTTPLDTTDGVFFQKDDGDTNWDFHVEKDGTASSQTSVATAADDTWIELAFFFDGTNFFVYADGAYVATIANTNMPDDEELTVSFGIQNGAAAAKTMTVDYIWVAQER